jgi:LAO/AO transport system kinase
MRTSSNSPNTESAGAAIERGDLRTFARLITRIESGDESVLPTLQELYRRGGKTPVVGVTGPPGSGKSTLTDQIVRKWRIAANRVGVLAIDPSSPFSGGAILGDRIRMSRHYSDPGVFIRSMSSRGSLGGLASAASDTLTVFDAMGFDQILIETVGIGQSETDIMNFAQTVIVIQPPGAGDVVQSIKAGLIEIGDIFVVNKSDMPGAEKTAAALQEAIAFRGSSSPWQIPVVKTQASTGEGVDELIQQIGKHHAHMTLHPEHRIQKQRRQALARLLDCINELMRTRLGNPDDPNGPFHSLIDAIVERRTDPHQSALTILEQIAELAPVSPGVC